MGRYFLVSFEYGLSVSPKCLCADSLVPVWHQEVVAPLRERAYWKVIRSWPPLEVINGGFIGLISYLRVDCFKRDSLVLLQSLPFWLNMWPLFYSMVYSNQDAICQSVNLSCHNIDRRSPLEGKVMWLCNLGLSASKSMSQINVFSL
jgi:hypothetical protein